jgi:homopolymeric O-antigen transport system permease protein
MYRVAKNTTGVSDIAAALSSSRLVFLLAWQDILQRYRRSILGPFWITISNAVLIGIIGLVFGRLFSANLAEFFPSLAIGITLWTFVSSSVLEGCTSFILAEGIVKQLPIPLFIHVERVIARNFIILLHNAVIIPLVLLFSNVSWSWLVLLGVVGVFLLIINLLWSALFAAILCTRYRDLPQIVSNVMQVAFYVTPIMWTASQFSDTQLFVDLNPFYHLIEIVRAPLLGKSPSLENWLASIAMALFGWALTLAFFSRYRRRIAYWL